MSNTINGVAVNFGIVGTTVTGTGVGTGLYQSFDHSKKRERYATKDESGAEVSECLFNPSESASLTYIVKGTSLADSITQSTIPEVGAFVNISACTQYPALVKSTWRVIEDPTIKGANVDAKEVTLKLQYNPAITQAAS